MTFKYDPEKGDKCICDRCPAFGLVKSVLRGRILVSCRSVGKDSRDVEVPWTQTIFCPYCSTEMREDRR